jgi:hypothetical protein
MELTRLRKGRHNCFNRRSNSSRAVRHRQIHTRGATAASLASEGEFFHALRDCRQKFSIFAIREMVQALKQ